MYMVDFIRKIIKTHGQQSIQKEETVYSKIAKSAAIKEIQVEGELEWQKAWDASTKGAITKSMGRLNQRGNHKKHGTPQPKGQSQKHSFHK
jgi:hypothetical protein